MGTQRVLVKWNNHPCTFLAELQQLLFDEAFTDVTLICEDNSLKTHKVFLVALSGFFQELFIGDFKNCRIVNMRNIKYKFLKEIITLMYQGEVNIYEDQLHDFFKVAALLQVKGFVENSSLKLFAIKKLITNEKVNVEFIEETIADQHINSSGDFGLKVQDDTSPRRNDDELFVDPSTIVKQEIIEGNIPLFPEHTFTSKEYTNSEKPSVLDNSTKIQEECNYQDNVIYSEINNCFKIQKQDSEDEPLINVLSRSMHLDNQQGFIISDQCHDASYSNVNLKKTLRKPKRKKIKNKNVIADSAVTRTRSQENQISEITPLQNTDSYDQGQKEVDGTRENSVLSVSATNSDNSELNKQQDNKETKTNSSLQNKKILSFSEWFAKAKNFDKKSPKSLFKTSLSFFPDDFICDDDESDSGNQLCAMNTSQFDCGQKKLNRQGNQCYNCDLCKKKFTSRFTYLTHLKTHYNNTVEAKIIESKTSFFNTDKRGRKNLKHSQNSSVNLEQSSCQSNDINGLTKHVMQKSPLVATPFACNSCGKAFFYKKSLAAHMETHGLYSCVQCDKRYVRLRSYLLHLKLHNVIT